MKVTAIGLDLAKSVFQVHGADDKGRKVFSRQLRRPQMLEFFANHPVCLVGMEACGSAHYWARELTKLGHTVRLIAPQYVKPYVKSQKNDAADAQAICEAVTRPTMRFVPIKTEAQQSVLMLDRARAGFVKTRTALSNQIRATLAEFGYVIPQGFSHLRKEVPVILEKPVLQGGIAKLIRLLMEQLEQVDKQAKVLERDIESWHRNNEQSKRLATIPGIGPLSASALVCSIGDPNNFENGRQLSAWIGLVPRQHSSGGKTVLLGITKRGDGYLRYLLVHGARSALTAQARRASGASAGWTGAILARKHKNVAAVALANRNARIAWALLKKGASYVAQYGQTGTQAQTS
jgi:transposase